MVRLDEFRRAARMPPKRAAVDVLDDFVKSKQLVRCDCGHLFEEHSGPGARASLQGTKPELPEGYCFHCSCARPKEPEADATNDRANHFKHCYSCGNDIPLPEQASDHCQDCDCLRDCSMCGDPFVFSAERFSDCEACAEELRKDAIKEIEEKLVCGMCGSKLEGSTFCPGCGGAVT